MITTDFAPNENWDDALISFSLLFQPWKWKKGKHIEIVKKLLSQQFNSDKNNFHVHLFLSGRSALYTILRSFQLSLGSEVIVQAFTCEAVILPILKNRLQPVYTDIESSTFSMNPIDLEKKITGKTKVVILQHTYGLTPIQRNKILAIIRNHKLVLIEDIAHGYSNNINPKSKVQSPKSEIKNQKSIFLMSFGRSKALSSVFGSAILTDDQVVSSKLDSVEDKSYPSFWFILRLLLYKPLTVIIKATYDIGIGKILHATINLTKFLVPEISSIEKQGVFDTLIDKAYPNALAILLNHQLKKFEQVKELRALICDIYNKNLKNQPFKINGAFPIRYPILVDQPQKITNKASEQNIFLGKWYDQVVAPKTISLENVKYKLGSCPVAENICRHIITLPTTIRIKDAYKIIKIIQ